MNVLKNSAWSLLGSAAVTLITGWINSTPGALLGAMWYGWPVTWIRYLVIAPQYNPWVVDWVGLLSDIVFWFVVFYIVIYLGGKLSKQKPAQSKRKR